MKKLFLVIPLVFLLCFTFGCQQGEEVAEEPGIKSLSDEDIAAIKAIGPAIDKATLEWDIETLLDLWTEDTLLMNQNAPIVKGRQGIAAYYKAAESATYTGHKHELLEVDGYGDIAYARGAFKTAMVIKGIPEPIKSEGKTLLIFRKQTDGSWLISIFCWNSDLPLPE